MVKQEKLNRYITNAIREPSARLNSKQLLSLRSIISLNLADFLSIFRRIPGVEVLYPMQKTQIIFCQNDGTEKKRKTKKFKHDKLKQCLHEKKDKDICCVPKEEYCRLKCLEDYVLKEAEREAQRFNPQEEMEQLPPLEQLSQTTPLPSSSHNLPPPKEESVEVKGKLVKQEEKPGQETSQPNLHKMMKEQRILFEEKLSLKEEEMSLKQERSFILDRRKFLQDERKVLQMERKILLDELTNFEEEKKMFMTEHKLLSILKELDECTTGTQDDEEEETDERKKTAKDSKEALDALKTILSKEQCTPKVESIMKFDLPVSSELPKIRCNNPPPPRSASTSATECLVPPPKEEKSPEKVKAKKDDKRDSSYLEKCMNEHKEKLKKYRSEPKEPEKPPPTAKFGKC